MVSTIILGLVKHIRQRKQDDKFSNIRIAGSDVDCMAFILEQSISEPNPWPVTFHRREETALIEDCDQLPESKKSRTNKNWFA